MNLKSNVTVRYPHDEGFTNKELRTLRRLRCYEEMLLPSRGGSPKKARAFLEENDRQEVANLRRHVEAREAERRRTSQPAPRSSWWSCDDHELIPLLTAFLMGWNMNK
jgi:hypothetical protein